MFPAVITSLETFDVRFPTSRELDGSDAMNPDPDYSAAYVVLRTDAGDGLEGHGFAFTIGRGNDVQVAAIERARAATWSAGRVEDAGRPRRALTRGSSHDSQLRWLGPEKGVMHMAIGAVVNALWDLAAKRAGQAAVAAAGRDDARGARRPGRLPLPHRRAHPRGGAGDPARAPSRAGRSASAQLLRATATRLHHLARLARLLRRRSSPGCASEARRRRLHQIKLKVGADLDDDIRRLRLAREAVGPDIRIADRRQPALGRRRGDRAGSSALAEFDPYWIEEPTSPDDVLGHAAIRRARRARSRSPPASTCRTGSCSSSCCRPARSTSCRSTPPGSAGSTRTSRSCCSPPSSASRSARTPAASACASWSSTCRCSTTSRSAARIEDRVIEYVDHLHEHFVDPVVIARRPLPRARRARVLAPRCTPSRSPTTRYPDGAVWTRADAMEAA